jgi:hypothetical protein
MLVSGSSVVGIVWGSLAAVSSHPVHATHSLVSIKTLERLIPKLGANCPEAGEMVITIYVFGMSLVGCDLSSGTAQRENFGVSSYCE